MRRRGFLQQGTFLAVATIAPSHDWLLAVLDATEPRPTSRIGEHQVSVIREALTDFHQADAVHGGGYARRALTEYVTGRVLPMLQDVDPHSDTGAVVFAAAAEQTHLLGWVAIDDDRHALGQRYLIQALRLAQESGNAMLGAAILADMSDQARMLGYPREALRLATTGRHGLTRTNSPACSANLWAAQARAHAALGDSTAGLRAVIESERAFERIDLTAEPKWAWFINGAYLSGQWADTFTELQKPTDAARFARRSISAAADGKWTRREALSQAALARAGLVRRDLDAALRSAHRVIDLSTTVQSSRCTEAVRDLRSRISPYRTVTAAREFDDRAREILTPPHHLN